MDLRIILGVVRRFLPLVACGFVLAVVLGCLTYVRVDFSDGRPSLSHRKSEQWASYARVLVTQPGFKLGSSLSGGSAKGEVAPLETQAAVEGRLPTLATIYASFVTSDEVRKIMRRSGRVVGVVQAQAVPAGPNGGAILPIVGITALSDTSGRSRVLGNQAVAALQEYIDTEQRQNGIPAAERITLRVLNRAGQTELVSPRSKTLPIAVFLAVIFATLSVALILENLSPRTRPLQEAEEPAAAPLERSARAAS